MLTPYVGNLLEGMPKSCKLPLIDYGSAGAMGFYQLQLKDIMAYPDLQTEVFHSFREVGNSFVIFLLFEQVLSAHEVQSTTLAMPFQGNIPFIVQSMFGRSVASCVPASRARARVCVSLFLSVCVFAFGCFHNVFY